MKAKISLLLLLLLMLCMPALGEEAIPAAPAEEALLEAYTNVRFNIRAAPEESGRRLKAVETGERVEVYSLGTDWCMVYYDGAMGYCKTKWLYRFRSLQPFAVTVPGAQLQAGMAKIIKPVFAAVPGYGGNQFRKGDMLAILRMEDSTAILSMMRGTVQIPAEDLSFEPFVPWDRAEPGDVIGGFTTYYNEATGGKKYAANRQWNIALAASRVHDAVVPAGGDFSYKRLCAPITKANGYKMAPNISRDGVGYGGGICQVTTTLYNAALGLPLQITEWSLHRDTGVAYIPKGFDAAVGSYSDLAFVNKLPYDIRLQALHQNGVLTVTIARNNK